MKSPKIPTDRGSPKEKSGRTGDRIKKILGYVLAVVFLVWVFHNFRIRELWSRMRTVNWSWVAAGVALDVGGYVCMGVRWRLLLRPLGSISVLQTTQAVYAGLFINEVLPMRVGELARVYLVSRWLGRDFISAIPSVALERLFEGIWMVVGIGLTAMFVPLPREFVKAGDVLGILLLLAAALFVLIVLRKPKGSPDEARLKISSGWKLIRRTRSLVDRLIVGFRTIGLTRFFYAAFFLSLLMFVLMALSFWAIMLAYGFRLSFWAGAAVFLIVHFGTALPNAPANVGSYQFFCVVGLVLFGVEKTLATGFSVVVFVILTLPLWIIGFFALARSGMTLSTIKDQLKTLKITQKSDSQGGSGNDD